MANEINWKIKKFKWDKLCFLKNASKGFTISKEIIFNIRWDYQKIKVDIYAIMEIPQ